MLEDDARRCVDGYALDENADCVAQAAEVDSGVVASASDAGTTADADAGVAPEDAGPVDAAQSTLEQPCTSHEDCGPDAPYCDTFYYDMCLVSGCAMEPDDCPSGWECCDFSAFGLQEQLCVYADECPTH